MKLIATSQEQTTHQVIPVEIPVLDQTGPAPSETDYQVTVLATKPEPVQQIVWALPLSWKLSNLPRPEVRMHQGIRDWTKYSTAFSNWLYTCLSVFVSLQQDELTVAVPDQFIDDLDVRQVMFENEYRKEGDVVVKIYAI